MSGHSHAANVRHKKEANTAKRGKIYEKLIRAITAAARAGGPHPESNTALAMAVERAKSVNMPRDTIERTLKRLAGGGEGVELVETTFEITGPGGVAMLVECLTDNTNRTAGEVRSAFSKFGGSLAAQNAVKFVFQHKGNI